MCNQTLFCQENEVSVRLSLLWMQLQKLLFWNGYFSLIGKLCGLITILMSVSRTLLFFVHLYLTIKIQFD